MKNGRRREAWYVKSECPFINITISIGSLVTANRDYPAPLK
ncbi:hypothetical protein DBT_0421 [Dissulfuribacter thermophilus]|uniref:Uncharacterized protein n=1 Tax=Dissulfuribacter thermophilus TaxID=1156395 RepID=A0A1B9F7P2_9BACT|nr:hypothetical protein DBT_0421 [Dissulfuribacter thermophilus]